MRMASSTENLQADWPHGFPAKSEAEISLVVLLSALFEQLQHWVREHFDHSGDKVGMYLGCKAEKK